MVTKTKDESRTLPDTFSTWWRLPLTHIRDDAHLDEAIKMIDQLLQENLDKGGAGLPGCARISLRLTKTRT